MKQPTVISPKERFKNQALNTCFDDIRDIVREPSLRPRKLKPILDIDLLSEFRNPGFFRFFTHYLHHHPELKLEHNWKFGQIS